jgi:hypothetical protein
MKLGTTGAIRLIFFLSREALLVLLQVMAFGSTNPDDHPELASIAMETAAALEGCFVGAHAICDFRRDNIHMAFWNKILECQRNNADEYPNLWRSSTAYYPSSEKQTAYVWSLAKISMGLMVLYYQAHSQLNGVPKITFQQASAKAHGNLEVLVWKSCVPQLHYEV